MSVVYVSIGILINENQEILVEKNETNPNFKGLWQFPGGKVENGESPIVALQREILEELGVEIDLDSTKKLTFTEYENNDNHYVVLFYVCKKWHGEPYARINQEIQWCDLDKVQQLPSLPYNIEVIDKLNDIL
ncbi:MAG: (deoxy)nucleoside triphosphate pyrophosphohydrolase [Alphaproteobacteria bacterium]|jgi:8-oxo-dGTP diphosphatase|nr:(deoxy)nucleoside triphosphate pyrophosphohydrolase [Alphaproteobacteria bacterium]